MLSCLGIAQDFLCILRKVSYSVSVGQIVVLCVAYCTSTNYALKPVSDISTPTSLNLYTVLDSKLKLKFT